jgi:2-oxoglutarate ferredoxin oxidoreductase subunit alpha
MRIRAFPFGREVDDFLNRHEIVFVVEQNRDAQLRTLLMAETAFPGSRLKSILHYGGLPMDYRYVVAALEQRAVRGEAA